MSNIAADRHVLNGAGSSRSGKFILNSFVKKGIKKYFLFFFSEPHAIRQPHFVHQTYTI
jgi:hypothetical protein